MSLQETAEISSKPRQAPPRSRLVPVVLLAVGLLVVAALWLLLHRAMAGTNQVALISQPKGVTVVAARPTTYRPLRRYVGTIEPWVEARVGPQLVSAYLQTVLVRPGDPVRRGQVIATLDCRNSSALARSVSMQAKALEQTQAAMAKEAGRIGSLLEGGFVSPNEVEQKAAESASKQAQLLALRAQLLGTDLQVSDCVLRAPFDGEIGSRSLDPGAFVRPGSSIATVIDRSTLRVTAEVPENDFEAVAPRSPVKLRVLATGQELEAVISRRSPSASMSTRTVHVEINVPNRDRRIPSGTTADIRIEVGLPQPALEVPLMAASVRGGKANLVIIANGVAHKAQAAVLGEREGRLYLDPALGANAAVVTEGRAAVAEGDAVIVRKLGAAAPAAEKPHLDVVDDGHAHDGPRESHGDARAVRE